MAETKLISNSKAKDNGARLIFENPTLCSQLLRNYGGLDILKDVKAEDIEDVTERFLPMFTEERDADVIKKVRLADGGEMFMISLIEHKSSVDHNVVMQLLRYMVFIWEDYEKQMEAKHPHIACTKDFKYPPILPIVYYEDRAEWTAAKEFSERVFLNDVFRDYIPHFSYRLIPVIQYPKEKIIETKDELSVVMLINQLRKSEDFRNLDLPEGYLEEIGKKALPDVLDVLSKVISVLLRRINVPEDEIGSVTDKIKERKMGRLFENFEAYDVVETRKIAFADGEAKGKAEGKTETYYALVADGLLTPEVAAQRLGVDIDTFNKGLTEYTRSMTE